MASSDQRLDTSARLRAIAEELAELVPAKNRAYGNSVADVASFLGTLWPDGIPPEAYPHVGLFVRIYDKMKRIANQPEAFGEDPYKDIGGYGIVGAALFGPSARAEAAK
jgi:hypothetical protein